MNISMYQASAPRFANTLKNLSAILDKAEAYAQMRKIDPLVLTSARLYPDMFALARQVQIACDTAKGAVARLAGLEIPKHEDTEKTLEELKARIAKTLDFIGSVRPQQFAGAEERTIELKFPNATLRFSGRSYVTDFVLPNFYFHVTIAYALLRHNGVEIGKQDFLGKIQ